MSQKPKFLRESMKLSQPPGFQGVGRVGPEKIISGGGGGGRGDRYFLEPHILWYCVYFGLENKVIHFLVLDECGYQSPSCHKTKTKTKLVTL